LHHPLPRTGVVVVSINKNIKSPGTSERALVTYLIWGGCASEAIGCSLDEVLHPVTGRWYLSPSRYKAVPQCSNARVYALWTTTSTVLRGTKRPVTIAEQCPFFLSISWRRPNRPLSSDIITIKFFDIVYADWVPSVMPIHACPQCSYSTEHRRQLRRHVDNKHIAASFICGICHQQVPKSCEHSHGLANFQGRTPQARKFQTALTDQAGTAVDTSFAHDACDESKSVAGEHAQAKVSTLYIIHRSAYVRLLGPHLHHLYHLRPSTR